jgi:microsomal dipeptidase-like Zn-dependent dipeptidase
MSDWNDLHHKTTVVDLHTHPALKSTIFHRNLSSTTGKFLQRFFKEKFWPFSGRVTFPKMEAGGMDVLLSTAYVLEQGWIDDISLIKWLFKIAPGARKKVVDPTYFDATNIMLDEMKKQIDQYNKKTKAIQIKWEDFSGVDENDLQKTRLARLVTSSDKLQEGINSGDMCVVHSIEGAHSLQDSLAGKIPGTNGWNDSPEVETEILSNLEHFFNRGVAYLTLAHFYPNQCANPVFPYPEYGAKHLKWRKILGKWDETKGLTPIGIKVVEKMLELGMLIDISHCTLAARKQIYDIVDSNNCENCLLATHVGCFEINRVTYNIQDWELKWLADHGCVAGIIFMNYWTSPVDSGLGLKYIEQTLNHIINVCGSETPALGTDLDGFTDPPDEIVDMSELPRLTCYLKGLDYSDDVVEKFLGGNALRILLEGWKKK